MASLTRSTFICSTLRAEWVFVVSLRGPQNISNFWGEEEVRLLYTKRVLLVRFLGRVITLDGLGDYRATGVTFLPVLTLSRYDSGDIAARHRHHRPKDD